MMSVILIIFLIIIIVLFEQVLENVKNFSPSTTKSISSEMIKRKLRSPISRIFAIQRSKFDLPLHISPKKEQDQVNIKQNMDLTQQSCPIKSSVIHINDTNDINKINHNMQFNPRYKSHFDDLLTSVPPPPWIKRATLCTTKDFSILTHKVRIPLIRL